MRVPLAYANNEVWSLMASRAIPALVVWGACVCAGYVESNPGTFLDPFDTLPDPNWVGIPSQAEVREGVLVVPGENGGSRITSRDKFRYGTYTVRFKVSGIAPANYVYFGFMSREPWGAHGCMVILDGGRFRLQVRRDGGKVAEPFETPLVTPDVWHTLTIDWKPSFVEMLWDGQSCGRFEQADSIPNVFITSFIDVVKTGIPKLQAQVDSVEIAGGEVRRADRSGLSGPRPPVRTPPDTKGLAWPKSVAPIVSVAGARAVIENAFYRAELTWAKGLRLAKLENKATAMSCLAPGAFSELFTIASGGKVLRSSDFTVTESKAGKGKDRQLLELRVTNGASDWEAALSLHADSSPEFALGLDLVNHGTSERKAAIYWPYLSGLQIGDKAVDNYYLFPWKGGWCNNRPMELAAMYGQSSGLLQLFTLFNPSLGCSVYTYLKDESGRVKTVVMKKVDSADVEVSSYVPLYDEDKPEKGTMQDSVGTQITFRNLPYTFAAGQRRALSQVVLAVSPGDWRQAFRSYADWAHTWMKDPQVVEWYKGIFQTLAVHDEAGNKGFEHGFLRDDQWALAEQARPGDGLLEVPHWWNHPHSDGVEPPRPGGRGWYKHTIGQYDYWDELGGLPRLREEIEGVHKKGVRVNLYTCPYFAWEFSDVRKAHPDWVVKNADGSLSRDWSAMVGGVHIRYDDMCYAVAGWQDFMASVAARVIGDTRADGIYMDTMNHHKFCYNSLHQHPESPSFSAEAMLRKIRKAIKAANPQAVITCEDLCSERLIQFIDGSLIKTFEGTQPEYTDYDLYCLHFVRFYFPEIKYVEWGSTFGDGARRAFFNGVGYMRGDLGETKDPFTGKKMLSEQQLAYLTMTSRIMSENADAFSGLHPEPMVPALVPKVYANRFPGKGQVVWTLYNRSGQDIDQEVIEVRHVTGATYADLTRGKALSPEIRGGKAVLRVGLGNGEVVAVAQRSPSWKRPGQ